jgi:hypothetical protein
MGKRNWCRVEWDEQTGEVEFDIRVEREKGCGVTNTGWIVLKFVGGDVVSLADLSLLGVRYPMRVPPGWGSTRCN